MRASGRPGGTGRIRRSTTRAGFTCPSPGRGDVTLAGSAAGARTAGLARLGVLGLYYETQGTGPPLVLIHGSLMTIGLMNDYPARLAGHRQVIAVELQGHGHTRDIGRPLRYEFLADDIAALLDHLGLDQADLVGYSLGAGVAMQVPIRHPGRVRRLASLSASYRTYVLHYRTTAGVHDT